MLLRNFMNFLKSMLLILVLGKASFTTLYSMNKNEATPLSYPFSQIPLLLASQVKLHLILRISYMNYLNAARCMKCSQLVLNLAD